MSDQPINDVPINDVLLETVVSLAVNGMRHDLSYVKEIEKVLDLELDPGSIAIGMYLALSITQREDPLGNIKMAPEVWRRIVMDIRELEL